MQWLRNNFGWIIGLGAVGALGFAYRFLKEFLSSTTGIASYVRAQRKAYVDELVRERDQLKRDKAQLAVDLENMTRAKDLRDDINAQDRETIRAFRRLCDAKSIDYSAIEIHLTATPNL